MMFCPKCRQQNVDNAAFCVRCGYPLQTANPVQPVTPPQAGYPPQTGYPPQGAYMSYPPPPPKKRGNGLLIGLLIGGTVLIAAAAVLILLLTGGTPVTGVWYSNTLVNVLEFKENDKFYITTAYDTFKGTYEYDKGSGKGVLTYDGEEYEFTVEKDTLVLDDISKYKRADADFDIDAFLEDNAVVVLPTESAVIPTPELTTEPTPIQAVETVNEQTMTLSFAFGDRTGTYSGEIVDSLPNGYGTYTTENLDGTIWTYEGAWVSGHFSGQGTSVWEDGFSAGGQYENDYLNGEGWESWYGVVQYEGGYLDGAYHGQGTYYNCHGEIVYSGTFYYGIIRESAQDRSDRVGAFKDQSVPCTMDELYSACDNELSIRAEVSGEIFWILYSPESSPTYCRMLIYVDGVCDQDHIIEVNYELSEGEALPVEGQTVTVWGTTEYLYSYTTYDGDYLTVPLLQAWSVE